MSHWFVDVRRVGGHLKSDTFRSSTNIAELFVRLHSMPRGASWLHWLGGSSRSLHTHVVRLPQIFWFCFVFVSVPASQRRLHCQLHFVLHGLCAASHKLLCVSSCVTLKALLLYRHLLLLYPILLMSTVFFVPSSSVLTSTPGSTIQPPFHPLLKTL